MLSEGARLFAGRGFTKVTVRDICAAAQANVASVNYHFGDKMGLYSEVVESCLETLERTTRKAIAAGDAGDPETQLREFIRALVGQLLAPQPGMPDTPPVPGNVVQQLMMHEMANPTPMLDLIARRVMRPRMSYLCKVVGALMNRPPADRAVVNSAASVHALCLMTKTLPSMTKMTRVDTALIEPPDAAELADHITRFSLAGIRELR